MVAAVFRVLVHLMPEIAATRADTPAWATQMDHAIRFRRRRRIFARRWHGTHANGFSLIELALALGIAATITATAASQLSLSLSHSRSVGAARYVAARLQRTRTDAIARNRHVALRIESAGADYSLSTYADGDGDGVLSRDIQSGVDPMTIGPERLADKFPGVRFRTLPDLPPIDASTAAAGNDPIRLGAGNMAVFTPIGTASSGTVYILGDAELQFAVRILGETGRTRILRFDRRTRQWTPLSGR